MYWYTKLDGEEPGYMYSYFEYRPLNNTLTINTKCVKTHEEFIEWYNNNKSL